MYECIVCSFESKYKSNFEKHIKTKKHLRNIKKKNQINSINDNKPTIQNPQSSNNNVLEKYEGNLGQIEKNENIPIWASKTLEDFDTEVIIEEEDDTLPEWYLKHLEETYVNLHDIKHNDENALELLLEKLKQIERDQRELRRDVNKLKKVKWEKTNNTTTNNTTNNTINVNILNNTETLPSLKDILAFVEQKGMASITDNGNNINSIN